MLPSESRFNPNSDVVRSRERRVGATPAVARYSGQSPLSSTGVEDSGDSTCCPSKKPAQGEASIVVAKIICQQFDRHSTERPKRRTAIEVSRRKVMILWNRLLKANNSNRLTYRAASQGYSLNRQRASKTSANIGVSA